MRRTAISLEYRGEGGGRTRIAGAVVLLLLVAPAVAWAAELEWYGKRDPWQETLLAALAAGRRGGAAREAKPSCK